MIFWRFISIIKKSIMIYLLLAIDIFLTAAAQLSLRMGALRISSIEFSYYFFIGLAKNYFLILGLSLFAVSFFLYTFILSKLQLNIAYPIATGMVLVIITIFSQFLLKESLTAVQAVGIFAVIVGVVLILLPR